MAADKVGRYEILNELGRGGMAQVYLGHDPLMKRQVAIKIISDQLSTNPTFQERFQREAEVIASLEHPAIVPIYDFGHHEGQAFIVMRYMQGGSLADRLRDGPLSLRQIAPIMERVATGLDEAHAKGIIHRDIKPANMLFNARGDVMLSDFGLAKVTNYAGDLTKNTLVGTANFMSPEQIMAEELDGRSDVYSLGIVLFYTLTGKLPFQKKTIIATAMAHLEDPIPKLQEFQPTSRLPWDDILQRALAKEPADRYASAGEFARDVNSLLSGRWYLNKLLD